jgi:hypothetical protein
MKNIQKRQDAKISQKNIRHEKREDTVLSHFLKIYRETVLQFHRKREKKTKRNRRLTFREKIQFYS